MRVKLDDPLSSSIMILLALLLVALNALFVAAEFSFVRVRPTRVEQLVLEGNSRARYVSFGLNRLDGYLSVCQLGITLSSLGLGWLGEPAVGRLLESLLLTVGLRLNETVLSSVAIITAFLVITFMHVVFGELAPKTVAIQKAESIALFLAWPMRVFYTLFYPGVVVFNGAANMFIRLFRVEPATESEMTHTQEELQVLITDSYKSGHIGEAEQTMLQNVFYFEELVACDVMLPRPDVVFLYKHKSIEENIEIARATGHTRYPVCDETADDILGFVHIKDLFFLAFRAQEAENKNGGGGNGNGKNKLLSLMDVLRDVEFVPEYLPLAQLLHKFQKEKQQLAIVVDEYGINVGIVTMEDILEELVGDIQDEFDSEEPEIDEAADGSFSVSGKMLIDDLAGHVKLEYDEEENDYNTVAGYVIGFLNRIPEEGDVAEIGDLRFEIVKMDGLRIDRMKISALEGSAGGGDG
ncbi:MAG: hemolysin family protein [Peptococcaceae bacterium]|nr:hemolysin family protein [Peptococcaceae bacterium]